LKAFADCRAKAAALRYLNNMVYFVVGVYSSSSSPFALDLLTLLLHARTDPDCWTAQAVFASGIHHQSFRRLTLLRPANHIDSSVKNYHQNNCSKLIQTFGIRNMMQKMQKKRPQPEIESGTSCNLEKPKAGIIPLDH
jgi:hypothetical protein